MPFDGLWDDADEADEGKTEGEWKNFVSDPIRRGNEMGPRQFRIPEQATRGAEQYIAPRLGLGLGLG